MTTSIPIPAEPTRQHWLRCINMAQLEGFHGLARAYVIAHNAAFPQQAIAVPVVPPSPATP